MVVLGGGGARDTTGAVWSWHPANTPTADGPDQTEGCFVDDGLSCFCTDSGSKAACQKEENSLSSARRAVLLLYNRAQNSIHVGYVIDSDINYTEAK